jgi:hypothetical protein
MVLIVPELQSIKRTHDFDFAKGGAPKKNGTIPVNIHTGMTLSARSLL